MFQQTPGLPDPVPMLTHEIQFFRNPCVINQSPTQNACDKCILYLLRKSLPAVLLSPFIYRAEPNRTWFTFYHTCPLGSSVGSVEGLSEGCPCCYTRAWLSPGVAVSSPRWDKHHYGSHWCPGRWHASTRGLHQEDGWFAFLCGYCHCCILRVFLDHQVSQNSHIFRNLLLFFCCISLSQNYCSILLKYHGI